MSAKNSFFIKLNDLMLFLSLCNFLIWNIYIILQWLR